MSFWENGVDPDHQASMKPADEGPHCFPYSLKHAYSQSPPSQLDKYWGGV